ICVKESRLPTSCAFLSDVSLFGIWKICDQIQGSQPNAENTLIRGFGLTTPRRGQNRFPSAMHARSFWIKLLSEPTTECDTPNCGPCFPGRQPTHLVRVTSRVRWNWIDRRFKQILSVKAGTKCPKTVGAKLALPQ